MSFTLPQGRGPSPLLRILKSNLTIRPRLPVSRSGLYIKSSSFSSHAVLSRLRTASSTDLGNIGVSRRPGCVDSDARMHRQCMQGVRLSSTVDGAGTEKEAVKQEVGQDEAVKTEEALKAEESVKMEEALKAEEAVKMEEAKDAIDEVYDNDYFEEETGNDWKKEVPEETEEEYKARFPAIHDIIVKQKTGKGDVVKKNFFKAYLTLQGRKQHGRKPRVWVSLSDSEDRIPADVAELEWPTGKEGVTKATIFDWEENSHDLRFLKPMSKGMEFQVVEKTLLKGDRRIWREVVQKGEDGLIDGDKEKGEDDKGKGEDDKGKGQ